ncbi:MAG: MATE family efflux transporter [Gammaproteobacteria bacterium]
MIAIGGPLVVNNLCTLALQTIDTVMAGRLGAAELAAVALGGNLWIPLFLFAMGVRRRTALRRTRRMALAWPSAAPCVHDRRVTDVWLWTFWPRFDLRQQRRCHEGDN